MLPRKSPWPLLLATVLLTFSTSCVSAQETQVYTLCGNDETTETVSLNASSPGIIIRSPNYGYLSYPPKMHCSLVLRTSVDPLILSLRIQHLSIELERECYYDYLCMHGVKFCGSATTNGTFQYIVPEQSFFTLFFKSDYISELSGFQIILTSELAEYQIIEEARGGVGSNISNLVYTTTAYQPGYQYTDRCPTPPEESEEIINATKDNPPNDQPVPDVYTFCDESPIIVNIDINSSPILIHSPFFGFGLYPTNINCAVVFRSGDTPLILTFTYKHFQIENHPECYFDALCVSGIKFCGDRKSGEVYQNILPEKQDLTILLLTDSSVAKSGIEILVTAEAASNRTISQAVGTQSNYQNNNTFNVTYEPGMFYSDSCSQFQQPPSYPPYSTPNAITTERTTTDYVPTNVDRDNITNVNTLCDFAWSGFIDVHAQSSPVLIRSPNFGKGDYQNNLSCRTIIRSGPEPLVLSLSFSTFELELQTPNCSWDSLCMHGVLFCGDWLTKRTVHYIIPAFSYFTLFFKTDMSATKPGFEIILVTEFANSQTVQQITGGVGFSENSITRTSATYYPGYDYADRCEDLVQTTLLPNFTTPYPTTFEPGTTRPTVPYDPNAHYFCDNNRSNIVNINVASPPLRIRSPYFGSRSYDNNQNCILSLQSGMDPLVVYFNYTYFALESQLSCFYDSLCVHGVKFCGYWLTGYIYPYILPANSSLTIIFQSDSSVILGGFEIIVTVELAINQTIEEVDGGFGSSENTISNRTVSYQPGFPYIDRCVAPPTFSTAHTYQPASDDFFTPINSTTPPMPVPASEDPPNTHYFCDYNQSNIIDITAYSSPLVIRSPHYGSRPYDNNQYCSLVFQSHWEPLILHFNYTYFALEYQVSCNYDKLCVHGVSYCGLWETGEIFSYILTPYNTFTINFKSDVSVQQAGFEIIVTTEYATNQTIELVAEGVGSSKSSIINRTITYESGYPYYDKCQNIPPSTTTTPIPENTTEIMNVHYFCDNSRSPYLYVGTYTSSLHIRSPNFGIRPYDDNQYCSLYIMSSWEPLILSFNYTHFELEYNTNCGYDYLCVHGVPFCSSWLAGRTLHYILPAYQSFTMTFKTDGSVVSSGFEIKITAKHAINQTIEEVDGGVGSSESTISNRTVSYQPGFPYTNRCAATTTTTPFYETTPGFIDPNVHYFCDNSRSPYVYISPFTPQLRFRSPYFGTHPYDNNQYCSLFIQSGWEPLVLSFNYTHFQLENDTNCGYDYLCVHGVAFCSSWLAGHTLQYFLPAYQSLSLTFKTDRSGVYSGFEIIVTAEHATNQTIEEIDGGVGSSESSISNRTVSYQPGFPYTDRCAPATTTMDPTTPIYTMPQNTETTTGFIVNNVNFCDNSSSPYVFINANSAPIRIRSPNFGLSSYDNNQFCTLVIQAGWDPLVLSFNYRYFHVEPATSCVYDFLCVHGVRFCSSWLAGHTFEYFLPAYQNFTMTFKTDASVGYSGFEIEVSQRRVTHQSVLEAHGEGSDYSTVYFTNTSFPLEHPYKDKCSDSYTSGGSTTTSVPPFTDFPHTRTTTGTVCLTNFDEIDAAIEQAISSMQRARALLRQPN